MNLGLVVQLVSIIGGGGVASWIWAWRRDRHEQYRLLDSAYAQLLAEYRKTPRFGDPQLTSRYEQVFADSLDYHFFAMTVHNVLETIFDTLDRAPESHREWSSVFAYHAALHATWLHNNSEAFEPEYVASVKKAARNVLFMRARSTQPLAA